MAHPFAKIFDAALKKSTLAENAVFKEAEKLKEKGYGASEIHAVLLKLKQGLIDDTESEIAAEAAEEFEKYVQ